MAGELRADTGVIPVGHVEGIGTVGGVCRQHLKRGNHRDAIGTLEESAGAVKNHGALLHKAKAGLGERNRHDPVLRQRRVDTFFARDTQERLTFLLGAMEVLEFAPLQDAGVGDHHDDIEGDRIHVPGIDRAGDVLGRIVDAAGHGGNRMAPKSDPGDV